MITFLACLVDHEFVLTSLARLGLFYAYVRMLIFMINGMFGSLEMEESRGERRVVKRRVKRTCSLSSCLDVFKISKGEKSN